MLIPVAILVLGIITLIAYLFARDDTYSLSEQLILTTIGSSIIIIGTAALFYSL